MPYGARCPTEDEEQSTVVEWCRWIALVHPRTHGHVWPVVASMNAGKRTYTTAAWCQRQGMQKGFPDLFWPVPMRGKHGLFIEVKRRKGGKLSAEQHWWALRCGRGGTRVSAGEARTPPST